MRHSTFVTGLSLTHRSDDARRVDVLVRQNELVTVVFPAHRGGAT